MFSPLGYGGGYHDLLSDMYGDSDDDYDHKPVDFLRPDGDIEGKDVQWCLDNNFFQVHDGLGGDYPLWSGNWYYKKHPEEKSMHQQRLKDTKQIRTRNEHRSSNNASSKYEEAMFCAMLQNDIARQMNPHRYRDDDDDSDCGFDDTPVDFLRPEGKTEGKNVQWCLDNDFFQVHNGQGYERPLWAGPWYYKYHPDERSMHQQRLKDTEALRRKTDHRSSAFTARLEREEAESKAIEKEICAMFEREMRDVERMRERQNKEQHKMRRGKDASSEIAIMKELQRKSTEEIGSKFASLGLNEKEPFEEDSKKEKKKTKNGKGSPRKGSSDDDFVEWLAPDISLKKKSTNSKDLKKKPRKDNEIITIDSSGSSDEEDDRSSGGSSDRVFYWSNKV